MDGVPGPADGGIGVDDVQVSLSGRLQDQYLLPPAEADKAVTEFLDSRTPPLPELTDESYLDAATFVAASLWMGTTDPRVVAVNEQLRRITGMEEAIAAAETDWDISERDPRAVLDTYRDLEAARSILKDLIAEQHRPPGQPDPTIHNTAYLSGAIAALTELNGTSDVAGQPGPQQARLWSSREAAVDMASAESAITLLREDRDRRGYTAEDAATAKTLRTVLDGAQVWDQVSALMTAERAPQLEEGLRPDRVRSHPGWDDSVVLEAVFAGVTIRVERTGDGQGPGEYRFLDSDRGASGRLTEVDQETLGVIAAGDRTPRPDRQPVYQELGEQVRDHLIGLAQAVTSQREGLHRRETRRLDATLKPTDVHVASAPERSV